jgi:hypothetical protein
MQMPVQHQFGANPAQHLAHRRRIAQTLAPGGGGSLRRVMDQHDAEQPVSLQLRQHFFRGRQLLRPDSAGCREGTGRLRRR